MHGLNLMIKKDNMVKFDIKTWFKEAKNGYRSCLMVVFFFLFVLAFIKPENRKFILEEETAGKKNTVSPSEASPSEAKALVLTEEEKTLLKEIYADMQAGMFEIPAKRIIENSEVLERLYMDKLREKPHYFDGEELYKIEGREEGTYLVMDDISTFYYGAVKDGIPDGQGQILNAYSADFNRYTYAYGSWKGGKLNGEAESGNAAFGELAPNTTSLYSVQGKFIDDVINGKVKLNITDEKGQFNTYIFKAENGVTVLDDAWSLNSEKERYEIRSSEDKDKKYSIKSSEVKDIKWMNKLEFK